jgi:large conductance mechanosensitive channel
MKKFINEFRSFAVKGNAIDMAVGIVIGGAFTKIVTSLVNDIIMPPLGLLLGGIDFSDKRIVLQAAVKDVVPEVPEVVIRYGILINSAISFVIVAFAMFLVVKAMNAAKKKEAAAPSPASVPTVQETLLTEIRDLLKDKK